jgi:anti-sigma factor RsiW
VTDTRPLDDEELLAWRHGPLTDAERARLAARLNGDKSAAATLAEWDRQDAALAALYAPVAAEPLPARLREMLGEATAEDAAAARRPPAWPPLMRIAAALVLLGLGAAGGWGVARIQPTASEVPWQALAAIRAHQTFAVEVAHPVEVGADQSEHLTRWLSKRLGHTISAPDFAQYGFVLMGGRILPADAGTAAVFMYENATGQRITLYAAPGDAGQDTAFRFVENGTTQGFWWVDGALRYAVVGDVPREVLRGIATLAWQQLA